MTDEQLNLAALALAGWEYKPEVDLWYHPVHPLRHGDGGKTTHLLSFLTGPEALGNVHELAVSLLTTDQLKSDYLNHLVDECAEETPDPGGRAGALFLTVHATPRQRLHAILHVLKPELFQ